MIDEEEQYSPDLNMNEEQPVDSTELLELCAVDSDLFYRTFFSRTARQETPDFHLEIDKLLDGISRLVNVQVFRGGAKTSKLRMYTAKRIAYGLAHTILYIGKSEGHAIRSINWIRSQVEHNRRFADTFKLRPGKKWQGNEAEIWHGVDNYPVWIVGMGITGSVRGINFDDFRPDLIVVDDAIDEENSATPEQREKIENLILGALSKSLAPASEAPDAKLVMLQTPLNAEDTSCKALQSPGWVSAVFPCWTKETADLPIRKRKSAWPARWSDQELQQDYLNHAAINKLSLFHREMECKLTSPETSKFRLEWLQYYDVEPQGLEIVGFIDPVPPKVEDQAAKKKSMDTDFEAIGLVGRKGGNYYLLEYDMNRGHEPEWTITTFFRLSMSRKVNRWVVEGIAYQRTLSWLLRKAMRTARRYWLIKEILGDKRGKVPRITDSLNGVCANRRFYCRKEHVEFIAQYTDFPNIKHEDLLDGVSRAVEELELGQLGEDDEQFEKDQETPKQLKYSGARAP